MSETVKTRTQAPSEKQKNPVTPENPVRILQLYPREMNLYGDYGNTFTLYKRLEWREIPVQIIDHNPGDSTDFNSADIIVGGGGQDAGQALIKDDLLVRGPELKQLVAEGMPMLMICGMYQLFGKYFLTADGTKLEGISAIDAHTEAKDTRLIGNIMLESDDFGQIIGFENHSGQTHLGIGVQPLGKVVKGSGNNDSDAFEGARVNHLIATYLHGPILPKNPLIADYLLEQALRRRGWEGNLMPLPDVDTLAKAVHEYIANRPV